MPYAPSPLRVLVVEDEAVIALGLQAMVEQLGHHVCAAVATASEAVVAAGQLRPDIVLMDIRLRDGSSGVQAASEIDRRFGIPSLFTSAFSPEQVRQDGVEIKALGFLTKPYRADELKRSLMGLLPA